MIQRQVHVASRLLSPPLRPDPPGVNRGAGLQAKRGMSGHYLPAALPPSTCFTVMLKLLPAPHKAILLLDLRNMTPQSSPYLGPCPLTVLDPSSSLGSPLLTSHNSVFRHRTPQRHGRQRGRMTSSPLVAGGMSFRSSRMLRRPRGSCCRSAHLTMVSQPGISSSFLDME